MTDSLIPVTTPPDVARWLYLIPPGHNSIRQVKYTILPRILTSDLQFYFRPFSWRPKRLNPRALTHAQQSEANAAHAEAKAARPGDD
jgi:hypothetical protein